MRTPGLQTLQAKTLLDDEGDGWLMPELPMQLPSAPPANLTAAAAPAAAATGLTQSQVADLINGFAQTLPSIESNLIAQVLSDQLPVLGTQLGAAAANATPALHFLSALQTALHAGLDTLIGKASYSEAEVELALSQALSAAGMNAGLAPNLDLSDAADIKLALVTGKTFAAVDTPLDAGFGLPGMGIQSSGGVAHTALNYTLNFGVGLDGSGFYLNTADNASTFSAGISTKLDGLNISANLSRLHFKVTDESATDGDTLSPTLFSGSFALDLLDPGTQGADNKLRVGEATGGGDLLDAKLNASANVNLTLTSDLGSAALPGISADLSFGWSFSNAVVTAGDNNLSFGSLPQLAFRNVKIDLGSFFSNFATPVLQKVQSLTEPLQPIFDALTKDVPALADLVNAGGLGGLVPTTLLGILKAGGQVSAEAEARIQLFAKIVSFVNAVPGDGGGVMIDLGDFNLGAVDPRTVGFALVDQAPNEIRHAFDAVLQSGVLNSFIAGAAGLSSNGTGLSFPIIQNPQSAFGLLLGRDVDFFRYDAPDLTTPPAGFNEFFPVLGPIGVRLIGNISASAKLDFGYDSHGLIDYVASGFSNPAAIFNGFYVVDQDGPEATFDASLQAFAAVNLVVAEAGAGGGIAGHAEINLEDPTPGDHKLRVDEIIAGLADGCLFDLSGKVTAGLSAYLTIGWDPFSHSFNYNGPSTELVNFDGTACDADGHGIDQPVLARLLGAALALNVGLDAPLRIRGDNTDTAEHFGVEHVSGAAGGETVRVLAFALAPQPYTLGAGGEIQANGGALDDVLVLASDVLTRAVLRGGLGDDDLWGGGGADDLFGDVGQDFLNGRSGDDMLDGGAGFDLLDGEAGNDQLKGGADSDILIGGAGGDALDGGSGIDTASYITAPGPVTLDLGNPAASTGDAAGDVFIAIEHFYGSDFNDTLRGDAGSNYLAGDKGDDLLQGREGDDLLIGGAGADTLDGGPGVDAVSYIDHQVAVAVSLATGQGSGGYAQGDVLIAIENLEGTNTPGLAGDVLEGGAGDNQLRGLGGADTLRGLGGNDWLLGGIDNDLLEGGDGNDLVQGEGGPDDLRGGSGNDVLEGGDDSDSLHGGDGVDTLRGQAGDDSLDGDSGDDVLDGGIGKDVLRDLVGNNQLFGGEGNDTLIAGAGQDMLDGGVGDDNAAGGGGDDAIFGGEGKDALDGGFGNDRLDGGNGDDLLSVGTLRAVTQDPDRRDHLFGGAGFDAITVDFSNQTVPIVIITGPAQSLVFADGTEARDFETVHDLFSGSADDVITLDTASDDAFGNFIATGAGMDSVASGRGDDIVFGGLDKDVIDGGLGADQLHGDEGDDLLIGGLGIDVIDGDAGVDFVLEGESYLVGGQVLRGGSGVDTVSYARASNSISGLEINFAIGRATWLDDRNSLIASPGIGLTDAFDSVTGFENIVGSQYADRLIGDAGNNVFEPGMGYLSVPGVGITSALVRFNQVYGGGGDDTLRIDYTNDDLANLTGVRGTTEFYYRFDPATNVIHDGTFVQTHPAPGSNVFQPVQHRQITGASKDDFFSGAGYDDILVGAAGHDVIAGGVENYASQQVGSFVRTTGSDTILGGDGNDILAGAGYVQLNPPSSNGQQTFNETPHLILLADPLYASIFQIFKPDGSDFIDGGAGDDEISDYILPVNNAGQPSPLWRLQLDGGSGFDTLSADYSNQTQAVRWDSAAPSANEFVDGGYFRNFEQIRVLFTGSGNDAIAQAGRVDNTFYTFGGDDVIRPGLGIDRIAPGVGNDTLIVDYGVGDAPELSGVVAWNGPLGSGIARHNLASGQQVDQVFLFLAGGPGDGLVENFQFTGTPKPDIIRAGFALNQTITSGAGNDQIYLLVEGINLVDAGEGDDYVEAGVSSGGVQPISVNRIDGGPGFDTLGAATVANQTVPVSFDSRAPSDLNFADGTTYRNFEAIQVLVTGSSNDTLVQLGRLNNGLRTNAGDDFVNPGLGLDEVDGGDGDDALAVDYSAGESATLGGVTLTSQDQFGRFYRILQRSDLATGQRIDFLRATNFEGFDIIGSSQNDVLDDDRVPLDGRTTIFAGAGDDVVGVQMFEADLRDLLDGGPGFDTLSRANFSNQTQAIVFDSTAARNDNIFADGYGFKNFEAVANLLTGSGDDFYRQLGRVNSIFLRTGDGNDTIAPGLGFDQVDGDAGNDLLMLDYSDGDTPGGSGITTTGAAAGNILRTSGGVVDSLGYNSIERFDITGTSHNDTLVGGSLTDALRGGGGSDSLQGRGGDDLLSGGAGSDAFAFTAASDGTDTITDFEAGDVLRIHGASLNGDSFVPSAAGLGRNQINVSSAGGITTLLLGLDNAPGADLVIQLQGLSAAASFTASGTDIALGANSNHPPTGSATAVLVAGSEDTAYEVLASLLLEGFSDPDGDILSVLDLAADHGAVADNGAGRWTFTPEHDYNGSVALTYTVSDGRGGLAAAQQTIALASVNDPAVIVPANVSVAETNAPIAVAGVLTISDVDSPALFVTQAAVAGLYGVFNLGANGAWNYTATSAYDSLNPGDSLVDVLPLASVDGTPSSVTVTITGSADFTTLRLGDAPLRQSGAGGQWLAAWTLPGYTLQHKADHSDAAAAWSAVKLHGVSPQLLSGGDIYAGDLGVSGQAAATSAVRQEIDGKEALRVTVPAGLDSVTVKLASLFPQDDGSVFSESGLLRLLDGAGQVLAEKTFVASALTGAQSVFLAAPAGVVAMELMSGAYDAAGHFVYGAYSDAQGAFGSAIYADAVGKLHGSEFLLDAVDFTVQLVGIGS